MTSKDESIVQQEIQMEAAKYGIILLRNNSGALPDKSGRLIYYGLGVISTKQNEKFKSSDLIGIMPLTITQEMIGQTIGVFTAVEVKREDWIFKGDKRETGQKNFIEFIKTKGGIAGFANSIETFKKIIGK